MNNWKKVARYVTVCFFTGVQPIYAITVTGQVVDSRAIIVEDAEVSVYEVDCRYSTNLDEETRIVAPIVKTDRTGRFKVEADIGNDHDLVFIVVARKAGYACAWDTLFPFRLAKARSAYGQITWGKEHCLLVLERPGVLTGQVVDADGRPVAGAEVQALPVTKHLHRLNGRPAQAPQEWFTTTTDNQGRFRFEQFATDVSTAFRVTAPGGASTYAFPRHYLVICGFEVGDSDIQLNLPREGTIRGRVVDTRGRPVGGVGLRVGLQAPKGDITNLYAERRTQSNLQGTFAFEGLPEGRHEIRLVPGEQEIDEWVVLPKKVTVRAGQVRDGTVVRLSKGGIVEITALHARTRRPLAEATIDFSSRQSQWNNGGRSRTDINGLARIRAPAGRCVAGVRAAGFKYWISNNPVVVRNGQTTQVTAMLHPYPKLRGYVRSLDGKPARGVAVSIDPAGVLVYTDSNGRFEAGCDPQVVFFSKVGVIVARDTAGGLAGLLSFRGSARTITLTLGPAWTLVGKVADPNGVGIPAARMSLHLRNNQRKPSWATNMNLEVLTDPQGRFEIRAVPAVQSGVMYRLAVNAKGYGRYPDGGRPSDFGYVQAPFDISPSGPAGTTVDIGTIQLTPADASVSGILFNARGLPAPGMPVIASLSPLRITVTDDKGRFTISGLCQGPIELQANAPGAPGGYGSLMAHAPGKDLKIVLGKYLTHKP